MYVIAPRDDATHDFIDLRSPKFSYDSKIKHDKQETCHVCCEYEA